jgi:hypothetical protein
MRWINDLNERRVSNLPNDREVTNSGLYTRARLKESNPWSADFLQIVWA